MEGFSYRLQPLALVMISAIFFIGFLAPLTDSVMRDLEVPDDLKIPASSLMWNKTLPALITLCGAIAFLMSTGKENPLWYLGIPLCVASAITVLDPFVGAMIVISGPSPPILHPGNLWYFLSQAAFFLLPACAALFFWSQRALGRWVTVLAGIALVMALNSVIALFFVFFPWLVSAGILPPPQPVYIEGHQVKSDGEGIVFLGLHYFIGMPVIGICFLALAAYYWYTTRMAFPSPPLTPEPQP